MSGKNLEQRIDIKFSCKIGKSASETLAQLTFTYGVHAIKKSNVFECHGGSKKVEKLCKMTLELNFRTSYIWFNNLPKYTEHK
jgi:hypothetical protein